MSKSFGNHNSSQHPKPLRNNEETILTMKLLIDKTNNKVLFAEAGKDAVDFLFHILSLPLGTVVRLLTKESVSGSIGNIYGSLESLEPDFIQDRFIKDNLLNPKPVPGSATNIPLLNTNGAERKISGCSIYSHCSIYVPPELKERLLGYVKDVGMYMITDDLCVKPMSMVSTASVIAGVNQAGVRCAGSLEEREVRLDLKMGLELLNTSLMSKNVLSDVFLPKKMAAIKNLFGDAKNYHFKLLDVILFLLFLVALVYKRYY